MWSSWRPRRTQVGSYSNRRSPAGPWCSSESRMSRIRSRMRSRLIRPSARASGPARAGVDAATECDVLLGVRPVEPELGRALEAPWVTVGRAVEQHHRRPGARCRHRRSVIARRASRKSAFTGLSMRSASSMKSGIRSRCARSSSWSSGYSARYFRRGREQPGRRFLPGREQERRRPHDRRHIGVVPSGYLASAMSVSTSCWGSRRRSSM